MHPALGSWEHNEQLKAHEKREWREVEWVPQVCLFISRKDSPACTELQQTKWK